MAADIFISYSKKDCEPVRVLVRALEDLGWSVFWDRETPVGTHWREYIEAELECSKCVLVVWSSNSIRSEWVLEEAEDGKSRKVLVPVSLDDGVLPPLGFRTIQALDVAGWNGSNSDRRFKRLLEGLGRHLGTPPAAAEAPEMQAEVTPKRIDPETPLQAPARKASARKSATLRKATAKKKVGSRKKVLEPLPVVKTGKGAPTWEEDEILNPRLLIQGGEFRMGSPKGVGSSTEHPQHRVTISSFYIQCHPVTREEFRRFVLLKLPPGLERLLPRGMDVRTNAPGQERHPMVSVTWEEARAYAEWLGGDLPTEAQWEYATRAGTTKRWYFGDDATKLGHYAWNVYNSGGRAHPVGQKPPNPWGLYDTYGNVSEWCLDYFAPYSPGRSSDPRGPASSSTGMRVIRGGSYSDTNDWQALMSSAGRREAKSRRSGDLGFRVVFLAP